MTAAAQRWPRTPHYPKTCLLTSRSRVAIDSSSTSRHQDNNIIVSPFVALAPPRCTWHRLLRSRICFVTCSRAFCDPPRPPTGPARPQHLLWFLLAPTRGVSPLPQTRVQQRQVHCSPLPRWECVRVCESVWRALLQRGRCKCSFVHARRPMMHSHSGQLQPNPQLQPR